MFDKVSFDLVSNLRFGQHPPLQRVEPGLLSNSKLVVDFNRCVDKGIFSVGIARPPIGLEAVRPNQVPSVGVLGEYLVDYLREMGRTDPPESRYLLQPPKIVSIEPSKGRHGLGH